MFQIHSSPLFFRGVASTCGAQGRGVSKELVGGGREGGREGEIEGGRERGREGGRRAHSQLLVTGSMQPGEGSLGKG